MEADSQNSLIDRNRQTRIDLQGYRSRIEELRHYAREEGRSPNEASERDFWKFIKSEPFIRRGYLALTPEGNLCATWKEIPGPRIQGTEIALEFMGDQLVQYTIFQLRASDSHVFSAYGHVDFEGVKKQIQVFGIRPLMYR